VAFVLAIAERCLEALKYDSKVYECARDAIALAWRWEEGGVVSGDDLDYYVENADEESLAVYGCSVPPQAFSEMMAITSAMCYVTWHAYKSDGITRMSESIGSVSEDVVGEVIGFATSSRYGKEEYMMCLLNEIESKCGSLTNEVLGIPIMRKSLCDACMQSSRSGCA
jgi:hypothetical protein